MGGGRAAPVLGPARKVGPAPRRPPQPPPAPPCCVIQSSLRLQPTRRPRAPNAAARAPRRPLILPVRASPPCTAARAALRRPRAPRNPRAAHPACFSDARTRPPRARRPQARLQAAPGGACAPPRPRYSVARGPLGEGGRRAGAPPGPGRPARPGPRARPPLTPATGAPDLVHPPVTHRRRSGDEKRNPLQGPCGPPPPASGRRPAVALARSRTPPRHPGAAPPGRAQAADSSFSRFHPPPLRFATPLPPARRAQNHGQRPFSFPARAPAPPAGPASEPAAVRP